jgi:hypothetical protein
MRTNNLFIEDTRFIFNTNFSGDPDRDKYGSSERKANLIIPDINMARQLIDEGFNVKMTKPREGDEEGFVPTYYIVIKLAYRNRNGEPKQWPPKVLLVVEDSVTELDEESVSCIDYAWIDKVNVVLNKYESDRGKSLYIKTLEVFQRVEDDPILAKHAKRGQVMHDSDEDVNFNPQNDEDMPF